jgi:hypothetical protein
MILYNINHSITGTATSDFYFDGSSTATNYLDIDDNTVMEHKKDKLIKDYGYSDEGNQDDE